MHTKLMQVVQMHNIGPKGLEMSDQLYRPEEGKAPVVTAQLSQRGMKKVLPPPAKVGMVLDSTVSAGPLTTDRRRKGARRHPLIGG